MKNTKNFPMLNFKLWKEQMLKQFRCDPLAHYRYLKTKQVQALLRLTDKEAARFAGVELRYYRYCITNHGFLLNWRQEKDLVVNWSRWRAISSILKIGVKPAQAAEILGMKEKDWFHKVAMGKITGDQINAIAKAVRAKKNKPKASRVKEREELKASRVKARKALGINAYDASALMGWEQNKWRDLESKGQINEGHIRDLNRVVEKADVTIADISELAELRKKLGLSAEACDKLLGKSKTWWGNHEKGIVKTPRFYLAMLKASYHQQSDEYRKNEVVKNLKRITTAHGYGFKEIVQFAIAA